MPHAAKVDITWFDDDGDLTELDSSDESDEEPPAPPPTSAARRETKAVPDFTPALKRVKETRATTQNATEKSRVRGGLKNAVPCLKPPRTTNYSAQSLFDWIEEGLVELNPEYQRSVVWNEAKQTALIGSLFSNYYVPPIVFTVKRQDDGTEVRVCIDGKQRLTSIHRFMKGEIAEKNVVTNRKSYFKNEPGSKRKLIPDALRGVFKNKQITCVEYEDLTGEQEREIFQRVQLGVSLSPADRLPAINGPHADLVRQLRRQIEETAGFELYLQWGSARGKDFQALAQVVYLLKFSHQSKNIEPTTTRLEKFLGEQAPDPELKKLEELAMRVMRIYCRIAKEYGEPLRKNLMPLEFVMTCFLISTHRKRLTDAQLSHAIGLMRIAFTKGDKKTSTKSFKLLLSFVLKDVPKLAQQLSYDPADTQTADDKTDSEQASCATSQFTHIDTDSKSDLTKGKAAAKRKLPESDNEDYVLPKKIKHKVEAQAIPPLESSSSISKVSKVDIPKSRLSLNARAGTAKTLVKARKVSDKKPLDSQTATPSVRPAPSLRTGTTTMSATTTKKASLTSSSAVLAIPSPRIPLPTRTRTVTTNSMNAASCPQPQLQSASTQEVSHSPRLPPQASPTDRPPSRGGVSVPPNPPLSTGGLQATVNVTGDRLAPLRIAKATMAQDTGACYGAGRAVSMSVAIPNAIAGLPQQTPGGSAGPGQARRSSLPHFKKSRTSAPAPLGSVGMDTGWEEGLGNIMQSISPHEAPRVASSGMPIEGLPAAGRDIAGSARPLLVGQLHQLQASISSGMTMGPGPGSAGPSNAPSGGTLMTPTASPSIPQLVMQNQPQAVTRDPRKVRREQEVAARAAQAQGQLGQTHLAQAPVQAPASPYVHTQAQIQKHPQMQQQQMQISAQQMQQRQQHLQTQVSAQQQFPPAVALQQAHMQQFRKQQEQQQQQTHPRQTRQAPTPSPSISPHQRM